MKLFLASAAVLSLLAAPVFCGSAHAAAKGFNGLSFQSEYLEKHPTCVKVFKPFFEAAKKQFPGKLSFDYFTQGSLFPMAEALSAVGDGRCDFGNMRPAAFPGKLNLLGVVDTPSMCPSSIVGSLTAVDLINKFPEIRAEFPANTVNFTTWASAAYQLHTFKPVQSLADVRGLKVVVWDAPSLEYMKALGANPIRMVSHDTYLALSKGMADAVLCPLAPVRSLKVSDICKHHLLLNLFTCNFLEQANKTLWDSFPDDMRAWLAGQGGAKMALDAALSLDGGAKADTEWMKAQGHSFYRLSDADQAALVKAMEPFIETWRGETSKSFDPKLVDEVLKFCRERSSFYQQEVKSGKYGDFNI